jgi:hypothetical protein
MQSVEHHDRTFMAHTTERTAIKSIHALQIWQFINILLSALITGVFWGSWLGPTNREWLNVGRPRRAAPTIRRENYL